MQELGFITNTSESETPIYRLQTINGYTASLDDIGYKNTYEDSNEIDSASIDMSEFTNGDLEFILNNDGKCMVEFEMVSFTDSDNNEFFKKEFKQHNGKLIVTPYEPTVTSHRPNVN